MKSRLRIIIPLLLIVLAVVLVWYYRNRQSGPVTTISGNGTVEATETDISPEISGRVVKLTVDEGSQVTKGQLIAALDSDVLRTQVVQAQGNLKAMQAALAVLIAGTRPENIHQAQAEYDAAMRMQQQAQAALDLLTAGTRPEETAQARAAYHQAQAQLSLVKEGPRKEQVAQLRAALAQAKANETNAEANFARVEALFAQDAVAKRDLDAARAQRDVAREQVAAAEQALLEAERGPRPQEVHAAEDAVKQAQQKLAEAVHGARPEQIRQAKAAVAQAKSQVAAAKAALDLAVAGARKEDIDAARARVEQARGALDTAQASYKLTRITAPTDGRVTIKNVELGERVAPGQPLVRIADLHNVWLRVYIPEPQYELIKIGQHADVTTDVPVANGTSPAVYHGQVTEINTEPEFTPKNVQTKEERVQQVFGVKVSIDNPNQDLKPGMPADAVIYLK